VQNGAKLVRVLGRDVIGRPSRVTYVPSTDSVLVTDDQARRLRIFSASVWTQQGSFCPPATAAPDGSGSGLLQFPSGHSMSVDGRLAVIDFQTKSIVLWNTKSSEDRRSDTDLDTVMVCQTGLPCPGNVAITRGGQLAVTDSKVILLNFSFHAFAILDSVGEGVTFPGCPFAAFVHSSVRPDRSCYHDVSHERLEQSRLDEITENIH